MTDFYDLIAINTIKMSERPNWEHFWPWSTYWKLANERAFIIRQAMSYDYGPGD